MIALEKRGRRRRGPVHHAGPYGRSRRNRPDARLCDLQRHRLYDAIEGGVASLDDPDLKDRISNLKATRDQVKADAERAIALLSSSRKQAVTPDLIRRFADRARQRLRLSDGRYRRDYFQQFAQRVELHDGHVRIVGSNSDLYRTLMAVGDITPRAVVPPAIPKWLAGLSEATNFESPISLERPPRLPQRRNRDRDREKRID